MSNLELPPGVRRLFRLPWRSAGRLAHDVDDELRFHLEMRTDELIASGMSRDQALAEARRQFGDADDVRRHALTISIRNRYRAGLREIGLGLTQDARFAARQLRRGAFFTGITLITLALGIGANSAIFSVVHHLVLAPLPYRDGDRIVEVMQTAGGGHILFATTRPQLEAWRARARSVEEFTTVEQREFTVGRGAERERIVGAAMEPNLLHFLGVHPFLGRAFAPMDARPGAAPVAILGYGLWQQRFAGRVDAVGETIVVDDTSRTIVGVAPPDLSVPMNENEPVALWTPLVPSTTELNGLTFAKLRADISADRASRELETIASTLPDGGGTASTKTSIRAMRPQDFLGSEFQRALFLLFGAVGVVLVIACANVANLLLVRSWGRQREFAIRTSLGAGRARLARQLFTESIVLSATGGLLGLLLAWGGLHFFRRLRPVGLEALDGVRVESAVFFWTAAVAIATGIVFGLFPTLFAVGHASDGWLRSGARSAGGTQNARRLRSVLVVGEVALSVVLLIGAGLLVRSFRAMQQLELGFDPHGLVAFSVQFAPGTPKARWTPAFADVLGRVQSLPGIDGAAFASDAPPDMGVSSAEFQTGDALSRARTGLAGFNAVSPGYFRLARIRLRGRTFSSNATDAISGGGEAIINEALARRLWPDGNAIGHKMRMGPRAPWLTVIGVAQDIVTPGRRGDRFDLQLYLPATTEFPSTTIVLRSKMSIDALAPALRRLTAQVDPRLEVWSMHSSETEIAALLAGPRFAMALVGALALAALVLSAVGLYGVIAYAVSQRTREIGVRVALGAEPRDVARLILKDGAVLVLSGLTIGLAAAAVAGRVVESFLFGVVPTDPLTYGGIALLLIGVGLLASWLPARRATHIDPVIALSAE